MDRRTGGPEEPGKGIAAVVLAAGSSRRMGAQNKLLLPVNGQPMVRQVVAKALASQAAQVIVVVGHQAEQVTQALEGLERGGSQAVQVVTNPDFAQGMASSLRAGVAAVDKTMVGAMFLLGDMPFLDVRSLNQLISAFAAQIDSGGERDILVPERDGRRGNPILWGRRYFEEIEQLEGDTGARVLLQRYRDRIHTMPLADSGIHIDIDTPAAADEWLGDS